MLSMPRCVLGWSVVVQHVLLDVGDVEPAASSDPLGDRERVVAGPGSYLEYPLSRLRLQDLAKAGAGYERMRRLEVRRNA